MSNYPQKIKSWLTNQALPRWSGSGVDHSCGGFTEKLTFCGNPVFDCDKRLRVQARQIYVFSHASILNWQPENGHIAPLNTAECGYDFLTRHYWHPETGGFVFSANRQGEPTDLRRESYEQAFAVFAFAWFYKASGKAEALDWAVRTLDFMDAQLKDEKYGGYYENTERSVPRRQNPHMHLLEANLVLHQATGDSGFLLRARELVMLFLDRFCDTEKGILGEYFTEEWAPASGISGQIVEPGHQFEWAWLLSQYSSESNHNIRGTIEGLYGFACQHGTRSSSITGSEHVLDAVLRDGTIHEDRKRLWVQTEAIKAHLEINGNDSTDFGAAKIETMLDRLFDGYLDSELGTWQDQLDAEDNGIAETVPASSLYHVFLCLTEVLRVQYGDLDLRS